MRYTALKLVKSSFQVAELSTLSWIPQGIKGATLSDIRARKDFLLRKAAHTPGLDRWKQWSGETGKPYVTKSERKRKKGQSELCLLSLQDLDLFVKSANKATAGGQNYDAWLQGAGRRMLHSWSQRAASSGSTTPIQSQPGAPASSAGVSNVARGGHVTTGEWPAGVVGNGGAATHQAAYTGGSNPGTLGFWDPRMLALLSLQMQNTGIGGAMDNNVFSKK